jgi:hypothetical protein
MEMEEGINKPKQNVWRLGRNAKASRLGCGILSEIGRQTKVLDNPVMVGDWKMGLLVDDAK